MALTQISRDPLARTSLLRETLPVGARPLRGCAWCGQPARFRYAHVGDAQHSSAAGWSRPMCSVACYRAYSE